MKSDQVPKTPQTLHEFIMNLEDGTTFTIPDMRKHTGYSWHTCNNFIKKWPQQFRPSIVGRRDGLGRPWVYKLLSNGPEILSMKGPVFKNADTPGMVFSPEKRKNVPLAVEHTGCLTDEEWNKLPNPKGSMPSSGPPKVMKIRTLEALFPDGIKPEYYERLFRIIELLDQMHALVWNQKDT